VFGATLRRIRETQGSPKTGSLTGDLALERSVDGTVVESLHDEAIWELMYFGHVPQ
jgi:hypothetical protein